MRRKKNIIIIVMIVAVMVMALGYALFQKNLTINSTGNIASTWSIYFSNITSTATGTATNIITPSVSGTSAHFELGLELPGDKMVYTITLTNDGDIDAIIEDIKIVQEGTEKIIHSVSDIQIGTKLPGESSLNFKLTVEFDSTATSIPEYNTSSITMDIDVVQDTGQNIPLEDPEIEIVKPTLATQILADNTAYADNVASKYATASTGINFGTINSDTNGKGLYYTSTNTEDNKITYYFRGAVDNNYVKFAGFYWKIIRINEDGSVRLIYQGTSADATGTNATIGKSSFNSNSDSNAYVGYMYGSTSTSATYAQTHANTTDSTIKTFIDDWYEEILKENYSSYLADAGFCNDRSLSSGTGIGETNTNYGAYNRLNTNKTPQFACPNSSNDLFTLKGGTKGNKALDYPIGLITADEVAYAGGVYVTKNSSYYLYTGSNYWAMSPYYFNVTFAGEWFVYSSGRLDIDYVGTSAGVRPVINLKSTVEIEEGGTGTAGNPYVVK